MKFVPLLLAALLASVSAAPEQNEARFIDGIIAGLIEDLSNDLKDRGLDPLQRENEVYEYTLPVTDLFVATAEIQDLLVEGISNIVINRISFSILATRLEFDISLPLISAQLGSSNGKVSLLGYSADAQISGRLAIVEPKIVGTIRLNLGIISGVSVRSISLDFTVKNVEAELNVAVLNNDLSKQINQFAGKTIPRILEVNRKDINTLLEYYVKQIIEENI